jgi:hypothetical protein
MDQQLADCVERLNQQNSVLDIVRVKYLETESTRKHYEARLIAMASGKSHAERTINAQATESWRLLALSIAQYESAYEFERTKLDVLSKEYQALYLSLKIDSETMRKT